MPVSDAFDLARLPLADWQPAGLPSADMGLLQSTDGLRIGPDKTSSRTKCSGIELRVGPPRDVGAMSPQ